MFNDFADALQYIVISKGSTECFHYMDDFITMGPPASTQCNTNLNIMIDTCDEIGFGINPKKLVKPTSVIEFIGFIVDTNKYEIRISQERLQNILLELLLWQERKFCTKRELLSLIGKLTFVSKVVRSGRTFVRRLIDLSKKVKHLHHRIRLNRNARDDIRWWQHYLPTWNGVGMFYEEQWTSNVDINLFTDASDGCIGAYFNGAWFCKVLSPHHKHQSINWKELYAIVVAIATWGCQLSSKRLRIHCDNLVICHVMQKGTSKNQNLMDLVRILFFLCAHHHIECTFSHISTHDNCIADSLSRLQLERFRQLAPMANIEMTYPATVDVMPNI